METEQTDEAPVTTDVILKDPDGVKYKLSVNNDGELETERME